MSTDHIDPAVENVKWRDQVPDVIHMNSIQYFGNHEIIFSARHLDAVYDIDMQTGAILWKLGGTPTAQSLTALQDPYAGVNPPGLFSGQHDARIVAGGNLTLQDNGTRQARAIRALRFSIDTKARTATELEQLTDTRSNGPGLCCGGVDRLTRERLARVVGRRELRDRADPPRRSGSDDLLLAVLLLPGRTGSRPDRRVAPRHGRDGPAAPALTAVLGSAHGTTRRQSGTDHGRGARTGRRRDPPDGVGGRARDDGRRARRRGRAAGQGARCLGRVPPPRRHRRERLGSHRGRDDVTLRRPRHPREQRGRLPHHADEHDLRRRIHARRDDQPGRHLPRHEGGDGDDGRARARARSSTSPRSPACAGAREPWRTRQASSPCAA